MSVPLLPLIHAVCPLFEPSQTKLHLATHNGLEDPVDVFHAGNFDVWQSEQSSRNFERPYVATLIATGTPDRWQFAGIWKRSGEPEWTDRVYAPDDPRRPDTPIWVYPLEPVVEVDPLVGRVLVSFKRPGRQSYLLLEKWIDRITLREFRDAPGTSPRFESYKSTSISMPILRELIRNNVDDWRTALSSVGGVYLISSDDRQYVGSASGIEGLWSRWRAYAQTGHAHNKALIALLEDHPNAADRFRFTILETADEKTSRDDILRREAYWKSALGSRAYGLNLN